MQRQFVQSSDLHTVGYDVVTQILEVEFNDSSVYQYYNVPEFIFNSLMHASSHGKYFASNVKNSYQYKKIM